MRCALKVVLILMSLTVIAWGQRLSHLPMCIGQHCVQAELALTPKQRRTGLMWQRHNHSRSMLFVFPLAAQHAFWMKNTSSHLWLAFINDQGIITETVAMQPLSTKIHWSSHPVHFALEVPNSAPNRKHFRVGQTIKNFKNMIYPLVNQAS